ncbi:sensory transduction histidine kinase, partial [mine drainage metagenome]
RAYFDSALIGMVALSPNGNFIEINESFLRMTGYTKDELLVRKWQEIKDPEDLGSATEDYDRVMRGEIDFYQRDRRLVKKERPDDLLPYLCQGGEKTLGRNRLLCPQY